MAFWGDSTLRRARPRDDQQNHSLQCFCTEEFPTRIHTSNSCRGCFVLFCFEAVVSIKEGDYRGCTYVRNLRKHPSRDYWRLFSDGDVASEANLWRDSPCRVSDHLACRVWLYGVFLRGAVQGMKTSRSSIFAGLDVFLSIRPHGEKALASVRSLCSAHHLVSRNSTLTTLLSHRFQW